MYSPEEREELEKRYQQGDRSDKVLDYLHTKSMIPRFVGKEDIISQNKTERFRTILNHNYGFLIRQK